MFVLNVGYSVLWLYICMYVSMYGHMNLVRMSYTQRSNWKLCFLEDRNKKDKFVRASIILAQRLWGGYD